MLGLSLGLMRRATSGSSSYLGQVATRSYLTSAQKTSTNVAAMARSKHWARDTITALQVTYGNGFIDVSTTGQWTASGGAMTVKATIEKSDGTIVGPFLWSGAGTGSIASGDLLTSDALTVAIAKNDYFFIRTYVTMAGVGVVVQNTSDGGFRIAGDDFYYGTTATDQTGVSGAIPGGTAANTDATSGIYPFELLATTAQPSFMIIGDSIANGTKDVTTDDAGAIARSIGPTNAYINAGIGSDRANWRSKSPTYVMKRLGQHVTHIITQMGRNDLSNGRVAAQLKNDMLHLGELFPRATYYVTTVTPKSTSTDAWATVGNQTTVSDNPDRLTENARRRALPRFIELADVVESARDSGLWKAGTTDDGLHPNPTEYAAIKASGIINPATIGAVSAASSLWTPEELVFGNNDVQGLFWDVYQRADRVDSTAGNSWSPYNNFSTVTGTAAYTASAINGEPVFTFAGGTNNLSFAAGMRNFAQNKAANTFAAVVRVDALPAAQQQIAFAGINTGTALARFSLNVSNTGVLEASARHADGDAVTNATDTGSPTLGQVYIVIGEIDWVAGSLKFYRDGTLIATSTMVSSGSNSPNTASNGLVIGNNAGGTNGLTGLIPFVLGLRRIMSTTERQKLEGWLAAKYGTQASLPVGHPYKSAAPTA